MIRLTGLAPWEFEFTFPGTLPNIRNAHRTSTVWYSGFVELFGRVALYSGVLKWVGTVVQLSDFAEQFVGAGC